MNSRYLDLERVQGHYKIGTEIELTGNQEPLNGSHMQAKGFLKFPVSDKNHYRISRNTKFVF